MLTVATVDGVDVAAVGADAGTAAAADVGTGAADTAAATGAAAGALVVMGFPAEGGAVAEALAVVVAVAVAVAGVDDAAGPFAGDAAPAAADAVAIAEGDSGADGASFLFAGASAAILPTSTAITDTRSSYAHLHRRHLHNNSPNDGPPPNVIAVQPCPDRLLHRPLSAINYMRPYLATQCRAVTLLSAMISSGGDWPTWTVNAI